MWSTCRCLALALASSLGLAACASDELAGQPGLLTEVKGYYERFAMERNGLCATPLFGPATRSSIQEQSPDRLVVRVSYFYNDPSARLTGQCRGFSSRDFTIAKDADGLEVIGMTGSQRRGIKIIEVDDSNVW